MDADENTATNQLAFAEASDVLANTGSSQNAIKGPRKSMGRRVSFAATAKVRLFEKGNNGNDREKQGDDPLEEGDDDDMQIDNTPVSPVRAPGTPTSKLPQVLSPGSAASSISAQQLPSRIPVRSPLTKSPAAMKLRSPKSPASSFEIDLNAGKADDSNSMLSSFEDHDGSSSVNNNIGNDNNNGNNQSGHMDDTMDFTTCVGGIAPAAAFQRLSEANTMDFTGCVGKILSDLNDNKYDELENDTMDLTTCIGGLLEEPATIEANVSKQTSQNDTMDLTRVLPNTIMGSPVHPAVAALKLTSPSPFLVHSPLTTPRRRLSGTANDVEFIDAVGRPDILNAMPGSPMVIDSQPTLAKPSQPRKTVSIAPSAELSPKREAVDDLFQSLIDTDPMGTATRQPVANNNNNLQVSQSTAACKDLLAKAGVRFMDNLTSLGRRETTGRPRESDVITPARHRYLLNAVAPEAEAVEERCREMVDHITVCRQDIVRLESQFLSSQAAASITAEPDDDTVNRLKTAKSVARLTARQQWYNWRAGKEEPLNQELTKNLNAIKQDLAMVTMKETDIDAVGVPLVRLRDRLTAQLAAAEAEERARASVNWEAVSQLQAQCLEIGQLSAQLDQEMTQLAQQEEELRQKLVQVQEDRRLVQRNVETLETERQQLCECSDLALRELKSKMALLQALHGWHLIAVKPNHLIIQWQRHQAIVQARIQLESSADGLVTVPAVQLLCLDNNNNPTTNSIVKHAPSVVKVEAGKGLLKTMISLLSQLDRLHHIDRAIGRCVKAQVSVDPNEPVICATVFKAHTKSKWSIRVKVLADRIELVSVESEYGDVPDQTVVKNAVDAANLGSRFAQIDTLVDQLCE